MRPYLHCALIISCFAAGSRAANAVFDYNADVLIEEAATNLLLAREMPKSYSRSVPALGSISFQVNRVGVDYQVNEMVVDLSVSIYRGSTPLKTWSGSIPVANTYLTVSMAGGRLVGRIDAALDRVGRIVTGSELAGKVLDCPDLEAAALQVETEFKSIFNTYVMAQLNSKVGIAKDFLITGSPKRLLDYPVLVGNGRVSAMLDNAIKIRVTYRVEVEDPVVTPQFDPATGVATYLSNSDFTILSANILQNPWVSGYSPLPRQPDDHTWLYRNDEKAWWDPARGKYVIRRSFSEDVVLYFQWLWWNGKYSSPNIPYRSDLAGRTVTVSIIAAKQGRTFGPFNHSVKL